MVDYEVNTIDDVIERQWKTGGPGQIRTADKRFRKRLVRWDHHAFSITSLRV